MKTIGTVLLVLVTVMGMAMPVLGATSGSNAGASSSGGIASQYTNAWANNGWEYASAGSDGYAIIGDTESSSGAASSDLGLDASAGTAGSSDGIIAYTESGASATEYDSAGIADADASSSASGWWVWSDSSADAQSDVLPYTANTWADGWAIIGSADSEATADAYV